MTIDYATFQASYADQSGEIALWMSAHREDGLTGPGDWLVNISEQAASAFGVPDDTDDLPKVFYDQAELVFNGIRSEFKRDYAAAAESGNGDVGLDFLRSMLHGRIIESVYGDDVQDWLI